MTVTELILELLKYNGDLVVVMSGDEEGNVIRSLYEIGTGCWNEEDFIFESSAWLEEGQPTNAIILWP